MYYVPALVQGTCKLVLLVTSCTPDLGGNTLHAHPGNLSSLSQVPCCALLLLSRETRTRCKHLRSPRWPLHMTRLQHNCCKIGTDYAGLGSAMNMGSLNQGSHYPSCMLFCPSPMVSLRHVTTITEDHQQHVFMCVLLHRVGRPPPACGFTISFPPPVCCCHSSPGGGPAE
jgi:hypothetical protein